MEKEESRNEAARGYEAVNEFLNSSDFMNLHELLTDDPRYKRGVEKLLSLVIKWKRAVEPNEPPF